MREDRAGSGGDAAPTEADAGGARFALAALLIIAAALLGGASRENPFRLAAVELCALPLVAVAIRRMVAGKAAGTGHAPLPLALLTMIVAVPLLQLAPLPPSVWTALPGQASRVEALRLASLPTPWLPLSLSPDDTGRAALALVPPAAMFVAALRLSAADAQGLAWLWIAAGAAGLALGLAQLAAPAGGSAYLYRTTNVGSLVGFFANRNHEAGFLLALAPFAAAGARPWRAGPWIAWPYILLSIAALGVIGSRAGLILAAPAALAALAVSWRGRGSRIGGVTSAAIIAAISVAAVAVALLGVDPILGRFEGHAPAEFRFEAWPHVIGAAGRFVPLGSGLGSFDRVFEAAEPLSLVGPTYFNHAHNDYLELWLETGVVGAAILALFLAWFIPAAWLAWRSPTPLAQASSAAIVLLLAQSTVDYPLRTETLAVLFAFCCGVLAAAGRPGS
jgi:O-antigen ligase